MLFYSIFYNNSLEDDMFIQGFHKPNPRDPTMISLKVSLDNAIIKHLAREKGMEEPPEISLTHGIYPLVSARMINNINLVAQVGAYFFILTPLLTFTVILAEIVQEKELRLRQGLSVVGVKHGVYWISWFIVGVFFSAATSLVLVTTGLICNFDIFWNLPYL
jgi:ABC-2 family transporter protein